MPLEVNDLSGLDMRISGRARPWEALPAAAEVEEEAGLWRICQGELMECIQFNPAARQFARRLLHRLEACAISVK